jgi:hypothetical protein
MEKILFLNDACLLMSYWVCVCLISSTYLYANVKTTFFFVNLCFIDVLLFSYWRGRFQRGFKYKYRFCWLLEWWSYWLNMIKLMLLVWFSQYYRQTVCSLWKLLWLGNYVFWAHLYSEFLMSYFCKQTFGCSDYWDNFLFLLKILNCFCWSLLDTDAKSV